MTAGTDQTSSMAQLLALLSPQGTQGPQGQALTQNPQAMAALMQMMGGGQQQAPRQAYQMPVAPPQAAPPVQPYQPQAVQGGAAPTQQSPQNIMAWLQTLDPATRARIMAAMGIGANGQQNPAGMGPMPQTGMPLGGLQGINSSPNAMPGGSPDMNAMMTGVRG